MLSGGVRRLRLVMDAWACRVQGACAGAAGRRTAIAGLLGVGLLRHFAGDYAG